MVWQTASVIGGVVIVFCLIFKKEVSSLLGRIKQVKIAGQELSTLPEQTPEKIEQVGKSSDKLRGILDSERNPILNELESKMIEKLEEDGVKNKDEQIKFLTRVAVSNYLERRFERISSTIYGSQLSILIQANTRPLDKNEVELHYAQLAKQFPERFPANSFDAYIAYLLNIQVLEEKNCFYRITLLGKEFLQYLVRQGLTHQRPF